VLLVYIQIGFAILKTDCSSDIIILLVIVQVYASELRRYKIAHIGDIDLYMEIIGSLIY